MVRVSIAHGCCFLILDDQKASHSPPVISILMTASEYRGHRGGGRKPTPKKPPSKTRDERYLRRRLLACNKARVHFPKQAAEHLKCKLLKWSTWRKWGAPRAELQGGRTRMFLQLKILKTTGGTNSNPANPWYWHAAYLEGAAAGESDVSLCIQSRNLL